jgi:hypothetical protein
MRSQTLLILLLTILLAPAGEAPALSPAARELVDAYRAAVAKAVARAQQELAGEREKLLAALEKEKEAETAAGRLDTALAIKARIERIASGRDHDGDAAVERDLIGGRQGADQLLGEAKNQIARAEAEPLARALDKVSEADWDRLGGLAYAVDAHSVVGAIETDVVLAEGETVLVAPNANDRWRCGTMPGDNKPMDFRGDVGRDPHGTIRWGCLYVQIGERVMPAGLVTGPGRVWLKCNDGTTIDNAGVIRAKILRVTP